jgi:hypothetical protein
MDVTSKFFYLARDMRSKRSRIESGYLCDTRFAIKDIAPRLINTIADWTNNTETGNNNPTS